MKYGSWNDGNVVGERREREEKIEDGVFWAPPPPITEVGGYKQAGCGELARRALLAGLLLPGLNRGKGL